MRSLAPVALLVAVALPVVLGIGGVPFIGNNMTVWRYWGPNSGVPLATNWHATTFDDRAWASGYTPLVVGAAAGLANSAAAVTAYRTYVTLQLVERLEWEISIKASGGVVVYVNGVEGGRFNMPDGQVSGQQVCLGCTGTIIVGNVYQKWLSPVWGTEDGVFTPHSKARIRVVAGWG